MSRIEPFFFLLTIIFLNGCKNRADSYILSPNMKITDLKSVDGPYIYGLNDSIEIVKVKRSKDSIFYIEREKQKKDSNQFFECEVSIFDKDNFLFSLMNSYSIPDEIYKPQEKIFVTSDIEGNFNAFYSMLVGNGIMNKEYQWTFGNGHLVIAGDMVDRGNNVMPCLWLLYKLEQDAKEVDGQVHFILGNHDVMNIQLDIRYVRPKYIKLAKILSGEEDEKKAYHYLMSSSNELVKWITSKNAVEKIGKNLILHGGISSDVVDAKLSINEINNLVRQHISEHLIRKPGDNDRANLVFGRMGPLWYRGLVKDYNEHYEKISQNELDEILKFYEVDHIIVGHTIVDNQVTSDFNNKVIRVDIKHSTEKFSGKSQALFIEDNKYYRVLDNGEQSFLFKSVKGSSN